MLPLSKAEQKFVRSLGEKKYRQEEQCFIAEGEKICAEILRQSKYPIKLIIGTQDWFEEHAGQLGHYDELFRSVSHVDLGKISQLNTPNEVLIVLEMPGSNAKVQETEGLILALDGIRDPGNMGTLIRIADWFGIKHIICSSDCADSFNPKAIQASMGSFLRVNTVLCDLEAWLKNTKRPTIGAVLHGEIMYEYTWPSNGVLVIGSESHGIRPEIQQQLDHLLTIPRHGEAESLNAAVATGIICSWIIR